MVILIACAPQNLPPESQQSNQVCINDHCFTVEIVDTPGERSRGLMNREHLDNDQGMWFIHEVESSHPFWMKNTLIPLDIIWINKDLEIVYIAHNAQPCGETCPSINPGVAALYTLEINGGLASSFDFAKGDTVIIK
ncbi:MAG: DUF192 domain-containing protein [Candidatus Woesearchaeota archaeon]|nr:DUF192 domain-containing protein [Candidatus Woesearchaeota archaeon]MDP7457186.1 DUF192 domain-containing protein [Candidatus Woesearchaeota archaeon]